MAEFDDMIPENVDWRWIARKLIALQESMTINTAALNRLDGTVSGLVNEFRALRSQHDRLRNRVDALEEKIE